MTHQPPTGDMRDRWQEQPTQPLKMSVGEIRNKAAKFENKVGRRNVREYVAAAFVIACFGGLAVAVENSTLRVACGMIIAGVLYVVRQIYVRGSSRTLPQEGKFETCLDFYRSELARQRDLLRGVWSWYVGPTVPGIVVLYLGVLGMRPERAAAIAMNGAIAASALIAVLVVNWRAARKLQHQIDELDELRKES